MAKKITKEEYIMREEIERKEEKKEKNIKVFKITSISSNILLLFLLIIVIIIYSNRENNLSEEYEEKIRIKENYLDICQTDLDSITKNKSVSYTKDKLDFYNKSVVFVIKGYGNKYYSYDCMMEKVGDKRFSYLVYNPENAKGLGYKKGKC